MAEDKKAQGLSGARIVRLALALELGRVPAIGDVLGVVPYASNPRLSEPAKRQRKAAQMGRTWLGGAGHASRLLVCVAERPPMLCDVMLIIDHHYTHTMTMTE